MTTAVSDRGPGPRGATTIVAAMFRTYARHFARLIAIPALVMVPLHVAGSRALGPDFFPAITGMAGTPALTMSGARLAAVALYLLLYLLGLIAAGGALAEAGARSLAGSDTSISRAYGVAIRRLPAMLGGSAIAAVAAGMPLLLAVSFASSAGSIAGTMLLVLAAALALYVFVRLGFAVLVALLEQAGPLAAVGRSWMLVSRHWFRTCGLMLLVALLAGLLQTILELAAAAVPEAAALLAAIAVAPLTALGSLLIYLDLRARKEGYSAEQLAAELDALESLEPSH